MKYDRTHPIWEQACVAVMSNLAGRYSEPIHAATVSVDCADALIALMNKAIEETTTTEKDDASALPAIE
jgi:hypothetical protein